MKLENVLSSRLGVKIVPSLITNPHIRKLGIDFLDRRIGQRLLQNKEEWVPLKMISDQRQMLHNMAMIGDRWISDKRVSKSTVEHLLKSFGSLLNNRNSSVAQSFESNYGFPPPGLLTISPTKRCNLKCTGCYASSSANTGISLDFNIVNRIIQEEKDLWGAHFTVVSGGEPFMYKSHGKDILDLAQLHPDTFFLVYTNGTLINKETAQRIAELGNITPAISVEGFEKETDERRGKGVHKRILQAFKNLQEAGVLYGISVTATKNNAELILSNEFINYYIKQKGAYYIWIFQYMPIGRSCSLELMVSPEQRMEMLKKTRHLMYEKELFVADFWNSATLSNGCISAGRKGGYIYIDWNGNVMPCVFNPYTSHNILKVFESGGNLNDVLFSPLMKKIREWQINYSTNDKSGYCGNMFAPCPIRDHHKDMRKILDETNAQPADKSAEIALHDDFYYRGMCQYGEMVEDITGEMWENEFLGLHKKPDMKVEKTEKTKIMA